MCGATLTERLSRIEAAGPAHPQTIHSSAAGDLITARTGHSEKLLPNGKVLVAGGYVPAPDGQLLSQPLSSAELYDPARGTWSSTGSLNVPRVEFTATLLENGKVLVVGGGEGYELNSAELYDPATGTWSLTGSLNVARSYHAATLLENGKVLVEGGPNSSAELYDPATGTWSLTGFLNVGRHFHTATLLPNGKVLVVGGYTSDGFVGPAGYLTSAELYDPATGAWSLTGSLNGAYYWHTATLLENGKVLLVGSLWFETSKTTELYDPATGKWTLTGPLNAGRVYHAEILLPNGNVLVMGGYDHPSNTYYNSVEMYHPDTGTWSFVANLKTSRLASATLLLNGKVLVVGSRDTWSISSSELYDTDAPIALPTITTASVSGKKRFIFGENFDTGAVILLNGEEQRTINDDQNPLSTLIGKKAGNKIKPGDKLRVRNPNGALSEEFTFTGS
jgi:N-acetylneuraminic acid mutarotase